MDRPRTNERSNEEHPHRLEEADCRTIDRLKSLVNQCDGTHSSVLSILSELRNHVKSSDMLEALKTERSEMLQKVVNWAENSVTNETVLHLSLIEQICLMKAREGKLKAVIKVCDPLFKDIPGYHEARNGMEQIVRELTAQVTTLYRKWCSSWSTVQLDAHKSCITIDSATQVPLVTFESQLVSLSRECRTLRCLGFQLPSKIVEKESDLIKYGSIARQLEEIVNFYCTIGDSILLCQQPILIDAARQFTKLLESRNKTMTWDCDINQLDDWLSELREFARKFANENRRLHRYHRSLLKSIIKLFDLSPAKWRPLMTEMISTMIIVDNSYSNTLTWKKHWDYQLYKILDYHFNRALISSSTWLGFYSNPYCGRQTDSSTSSLRIDLTFKSGQIVFRPSLEEIQFKLYSRINLFLSTFTQFKGFLVSINPDLFDSSKGMKNIFSTIYLRSIDNLPCLYRQVDLIMSEIITISEQFSEWTCLYNIIRESHSDDFSLSSMIPLTTLDDYRNNLTLVKLKGQEFNKKFIDNELFCSSSNITINLIPIKVSVDWIYSEVDRLLINSLRRETESMSTGLNNQLSQLLTQLTSPPEQLKSIIELESFWLDSSSSTIVSITSTYNELTERCNFLSKWSAKSVPNINDLVGKYDQFQSLVDNRESLIASFKQLLRSRLETRSTETIKSLEGLTKNWVAIKSRGYPNTSQLEELKTQFELIGNDIDNYVEGCKYFNLPVPVTVETFTSARVEIMELYNKLLKAKQFDDGLESFLDTEWIIVRNKLSTLEEYIDSWTIRSKVNQEDQEVDEVIAARVKEWKSLITILKTIKGEVFAKSHWDELLSLIDHNSMAIETLKLRHLYDKSETLLTIKDQLKELNYRALGEQSVRQTFTELESLAASAKFDLTKYSMDSGQQVSLIKNWRIILNSISESIVTLNSLEGSEFFDNSFAESASQWESRLTGLNSMINSLNTVQRKWTYLEPIYSRNQGPEIFNDSSFTLASGDFITIMKTIETDCHIIRLLRIPGLPERLSSIEQHLASCQKKLNLFMEESRNRFPRFYFLADDDLLLVLAGKTSITESGLLKKLFNNTISKIIFDGNNSTAVESPEGEQIRLRSPVTVNFQGGSLEIENWLRNVESEVSKSLKTDLFDCLGRGNSNDDLIWSAPSQIVSLVQWVRWTASTEDCIRRSRLKILHDDLARQLSDSQCFRY